MIMFASLIVAAIQVLLVHASTKQALLGSGVALYPRAVELPSGTILASVVSFSSGSGIGEIYRSDDHGASFTLLSTIADSAGSTGLCCATLYRLPVALSADLPEGALLWAGSFGGSQRPMSIRSWYSVDDGASWTFLATVVDTTSQLGLWEPEFFVHRNSSTLQCYFSDETQQPLHSQVLARRESSDGRSWSSSSNVVASPLSFLRPGMANVRELRTNEVVMSYEVCASVYPWNCAVHIRRSADGADWGNSSDMGHLVVSKAGEYFCHTPVITVQSQAAGSRLLLTAQMLRQSPAGDVAGGSGATYFSATDPFGPASGWTSYATPVEFSVRSSWWCPNYSPAFLAVVNGSRLLEISSFNSTLGSVCQSWFGSSPLQ